MLAQSHSTPPSLSIESGCGDSITSTMARPNYSGEKRRKELEKQRKKEAKKQRKLENASAPKDDDAATDPGEEIANPSPS